jgi:type I restriction enzyme S subunit
MSTRASLNNEMLARLAIVLPPPNEQHAIADILGALDDKIELNRRMSETLEAMARAIFKAWFVDFEPVYAKMEGRWQRGQTISGLPAQGFDLFPDKMLNSEIGVIPESWQIRPVSDLAEIVGGTTPSTKESQFWDSGTHFWATPKDLSALQFPVLLQTERRISDAGLAQIGSGLLPPGTVLLSSRAPIGYLAVAHVPVAINQGFIAMKPKPGMNSWFLLLWTYFSHDEILSRANGSTFLEISKSNFRPIPVITPPASLVDLFRQFVEPIYARIVANENQSQILAALRNTLLPKLISGEIRIEHAEQLVAGSVS